MMPDSDARLPVVALINSTPDVIDMLRIAFEQAGFVVVSTFTYMIRDGEVDIESFLALHRPDVILYDIAPPYQSNWQLFLHLRGLPGFKDRPIVLTSTNPVRVREFAQTAQTVLEIVETPYEIMTVVNTVAEAAGRKKTLKGYPTARRD
jgi:CheY-like chemotaxis protein